MHFPYLFLISLGNHITRHIPDTLINDLRNRSHDSLRLRAIQTFPFQPLDKMVSVKVKVPSKRSSRESPLNSRWGDIDRLGAERGHYGMWI